MIQVSAVTAAVRQGARNHRPGRRVPIRYPLLEPLEAAGEARFDLDIHELRVGEIEAANKKRDPFEQTILLVANSARISPDEVRKIGSRDYAALSRLVAAFL